MQRTCTQCGESKSSSEFPQHTRNGKTQKRYHSASCRDCKNVARRDQKLRQVYGISLEQYDAMLQGQNGGCAICGATPGLRSHVVDHDHNTGQVRGLLCESCNNGIGRFQDNPALLRQAATYLEGVPVNTL